MISFSKFHLRKIGTVIVVVTTLVSLYVFSPNKSENMLHNNGEIQFDDVTIHPLNETDSKSSPWSGLDNNSLLNVSQRQASVSAAKSESKLSPIQPNTSTIQKTSHKEQGAWLTGTIEFDETSLSRSVPSPNRIGQRIEYFSQKND